MPTIKGNNTGNVAGRDINLTVITAEAVFAMFCLGLLKKTIFNNVRVSYDNE